MSEAARARLPDGIAVIERGWLSSNNILIDEGDTATLIDSGYAGSAGQTLELVNSALARRRKGTPPRLARLINTHSHSDHIGGNAALKAAHDCAILIPAGIEEMVKAWDEEALLLTPASQRGERFAHDGVLHAGQRFSLGGEEWQAIAAPGHDMAALIYYHPGQRLLISGDALWRDGFGILFVDLMDDERWGERGIEATRRTLDSIAALPLDIVIPGHGAPFVDVDEALKRAYARLAAFEQDGARMGRNAIRACFTFNLLDLGRLREDELPAYLQSVPFFAHVNRKVLGLADDELAEWLLRELTKAGAIARENGWITPTMAP